MMNKEFDGRIFTNKTIRYRDIKVGDVVLEGTGPNFSYRIVTNNYGSGVYEYFENGYYHETKYEYCHWLVKGQKNCAGGELIKIIS